MVEATITVPMSEFNHAIVEKIKELVNGDSDETEVFISVRPKKSSVFRHETREEYFARLEQSIDDARNNRNLVTFDSVEALEDYFKK